MYSQTRINRLEGRVAGSIAIFVLALALQLPADEPSDLAWQIRRLKNEVGSLQLLTRLDLSAAQKERLRPIAEKVAATVAAHERSVADLLPEALDAYTQYKSQAQKNLGVSKDVIERADDCYRTEIEMKVDLAKELKEMEPTVRAILTPAQLAFVESYSPQGGRGGRPGGPQGGRGPGRQDGGQAPPFGESNLAYFLLSPTTLRFVNPQANSSEQMPLDAPQTAALMGKVEDVKSDARMLNLINGLNLTADQMRQIMSLVQNAKRGRWSNGVAASLKAERDALLQARQDLLTRGGIAPETLDLLRRTATESDRGQFMGRRGAMADPENERLVSEVEKILTAEQRQVLSQFKPCVVPPEDHRDPVRAGQAETDSRMAGFLERMRRAPMDRVERTVGQLVADEEQKMGIRTAEQRQARINEILDVIQKARAMSETEFAMNRDRLAQQIKPSYAPPGRRAGDDPVGSAIRTYLLDERVIPFLKERLSGNP
ncbi:MAG: hypothetical protein AB1696_17795 [Planctomycetota bacterium]